MTRPKPPGAPNLRKLALDFSELFTKDEIAPRVAKAGSKGADPWDSGER